MTAVHKWDRDEERLFTIKGNTEKNKQVQSCH